MDKNLFASVPPPSGPGNPIPLNDFWNWPDQAVDQTGGLIFNQDMRQVQAPQCSLPGLGSMADPILIDSDVQSEQQPLPGGGMLADSGSMANPIQLDQNSGLQFEQLLPGVNALPNDGYVLNLLQIDRGYQLTPSLPGIGTIGNPYGIDNAAEQGFESGIFNEFPVPATRSVSDPFQTLGGGGGDTAQDPITIDEDDSLSSDDLPPELFIDTLTRAADEAEELDRARATKCDGQKVMMDRDGYTYINRELRNDSVIKYKPPEVLTRRQQTVNTINDLLKKWGRSRTYEQVWGDQSPESTPEPEDAGAPEAPGGQEEPPSSPPRYGDPDDDGWQPAVPRRRAVQKSRRTPPPPRSDHESDDDWQASRPRAPRSRRPPPSQPTQGSQAQKRAVASSDAEGQKRKRGRPRKHGEHPSSSPMVAAPLRREQPITIPQVSAEGQFEPPVQQKKRSSRAGREAEPELDNHSNEIMPTRKRKSEAQPGGDGDGNPVKRRASGAARKPVPAPMLPPPPLPSYQHSNIDAVEDLAEANRRRERSQPATADMDAIFVNNLGQQLTRREVSSMPNVQYMPGGRYGGGKWRERDTDTVWVMLNPIEQVRKPWGLERKKKMDSARKKPQTPVPSAPSAPESPAAVRSTIVVRGRGKHDLPWGLGRGDDDDGDDDDQDLEMSLGSPEFTSQMSSRRPVNTARPRQSRSASSGEPSCSVSPHPYHGGKGAGKFVSSNMAVRQGKGVSLAGTGQAGGKGAGKSASSDGMTVHQGKDVSSAGKGQADGKGKTILCPTEVEDEDEDEDENEDEGDKENETDHHHPPRYEGKGKAPYQFRSFGGKGPDFLEEAQRNLVLDPMDTDYSESGEEPFPGEDDD